MFTCKMFTILIAIFMTSGLDEKNPKSNEGGRGKHSDNLFTYFWKS